MAESGAVDERRGAQGALGNDETNTERVADRAKNGRHGAEYSRREYLTRHAPRVATGGWRRTGSRRSEREASRRSERRPGDARRQDPRPRVTDDRDDRLRLGRVAPDGLPAERARGVAP
jgi:hypothetical protein